MAAALVVSSVVALAASSDAPAVGLSGTSITTTPPTTIPTPLLELTQPSAQPVAVPAGVVGTRYRLQLMSSGAGSSRWQVTTGQLPPGLRMSRLGRMTGRPTSYGAYSFTVAASALGAASTATSGTWNLSMAVSQLPPVVKAVHSAKGPATGGNLVEIRGKWLQGASNVKFGTASDTPISVNGAGTVLTVSAPAQAAGTVDVSVTTAFGTSAPSPGDRYSFVDPSTSTASGPGSMPPPPGYSTLIFDDTFPGSRLDGDKWNTFITSRAANGAPWHSNGAGGSAAGDPGSDDAEYFQPSQLSVADGLSITAVRRSTQTGYPWTSGAVSTYGKFAFDGGYVQIKASMPAGAGTWPSLWMLPGPAATSGDNFESDIFEGQYTAAGVDPDSTAAWHLHTPAGLFGGVTNMGVSLDAGYHVYGLRWVPGSSMTWYVDGIEVGQVTSAQAPIPSEPMELILDLQMAAPSACCWISVVGSSTPSPAVMRVAEVQVYR